MVCLRRMGDYVGLRLGMKVASTDFSTEGRFEL
jgi:hypothetical protein